MGVWVIDDMDSSEWVLVHKISFADIEFPGPLADSDFVTKDRNAYALWPMHRGGFKDENESLDARLEELMH
ncbi:hypothetical protein MRB53_013457 [Persea americana]|uniref:Uncharacterized protein n=1 Tax=Persea americana TaxID=3435 RepID=A0ACC2K8D1_PERAE|nr:hypothetical protein MRB53_013457 [Persea americana]